MEKEVTVISSVTQYQRKYNEKGEPIMVPISREEIYERPGRKPGMRIIPLDGTKTKQSDAASCDVNNIVKRATPDQVFTNYVHDENSDGIIDVSSVGNYHEKMTEIAQAKQQFEQLPSKVRKFFRNTPENMVEYCHEAVSGDNDKMSQLVKLGLAVDKPAPEPVPEPPTPPEEG